MKHISKLYFLSRVYITLCEQKNNLKIISNDLDVEILIYNFFPNSTNANNFIKRVY